MGAVVSRDSCFRGITVFLGKKCFLTVTSVGRRSFTRKSLSPQGPSLRHPTDTLSHPHAGARNTMTRILLEWVLWKPIAQQQGHRFGRFRVPSSRLRVCVLRYSPEVKPVFSKGGVVLH